MNVSTKLTFNQRSDKNDTTVSMKLVWILRSLLSGARGHAQDLLLNGITRRKDYPLLRIQHRIKLLYRNRLFDDAGEAALSQVGGLLLVDVVGEDE